MRENRTHGSEGGESGSTGLSYPYCAGAASRLEQAVVAIECRNAIRLRHGGVVEGRIDEVHQGVCWARLGQNRLADMDDLRSIRAETMDAKDLQGFAVEQDFEHALGSTGNLSMCQTAKTRVA